MSYTRFGLYAAPPKDAPWQTAATAWLGWDLQTGQERAHPVVPGLSQPVADLTETPRKYGLHGTLKPPFRLAPDQRLEKVMHACDTLAKGLRCLDIRALTLTRMGRFLALCPAQPDPALHQLAAACVRELDPFRAPPSAAEYARRRQRRLTPRQDANLTRWGYPYVMEDFRFHLTLTGPLPKASLEAAEQALKTCLVPLLPDVWTLRDLALVGEAEDGRFRLIQRFALGG